MTFSFTRLLLAANLSVVGVTAAATAPHPTILITDIGTDIDDTWALALALRSPELDLKLVLVDPADTPYRAAVAAKFLEASRRSDVPIAIGDNTGGKGDDMKTLTPWIQGYDLRHYPGKVYEDGVSALISTITASAGPVTIVSIGPVHSLALALERSPGIASKCRLVGMYGSFDRGYGGGPPSAETNVRVAPAALRVVLAAPWRDILLTPLDTCGLVELTGERYHSVWCDTNDSMVRALIESYCIFAPRQNWMKCDFFAERSTTLFDCAAVYLACSETWVTTEVLRFDVTNDGYTRRTADGRFQARVAMRWRNLDGLEELIKSRLVR